MRRSESGSALPQLPTNFVKPEKWYGHILRANEDTICEVGIDLEVPGKRPRGRPEQRWLDTLHADLKLVGVHQNEAHDRAKWRQKIRKADPATERDKR
ncbi:hypothetical protein Y032_0203g1848 [Ancylostoma ceylanicum]|uniref:Uncharacterized protein n=1 Tax=Ancylostoma ceylanicum TaxID=53326 RepID=A0A016SLY4_9BILA|nr:hypothetical protein Y032_0203g1848 [Ancylostoma ceylanicum]